MPGRTIGLPTKMTNEQHAELLARVWMKMRGIYDHAVPGGGELFDSSPLSKEMRAAIDNLHGRKPVTIGELEDMGKV